MEAVAFVIGVAVIVVGLGASIGLHEIGHLLPAKRFGVRVGRYMIGFGPTLWSRKIGETEYGVKLLPIGGYISMAGMYPPSPQRVAAGNAEATAGDAPGEHADGRGVGRLFRAVVQDARSANDETLEGVDDARAFYRLPVWQRVVVMLGGPAMNLLLGIGLFTLLFSGIGVQQATTTVQSVSECVQQASAESTACEASDPAAPAAEAGVRPGDVIVAVNGKGVSSFAEATRVIQANPGHPVDLVVRRDGAEQDLTMTPVLAKREVVGDDGKTSVREVGFAGMTATVEYVREPPWAGAETAVQQVGTVANYVVLQLPARVYDTAVSLFTGGERDPNGPLSVVGVGRLAGEVAATDTPVLNRVSFMVSLLGSVNIALFVFNLIPLLPLDGGHVAVALWDGLKRLLARLRRWPVPDPVDATRLVPATLAVVAVLIVVGGILIAADLFNPVNILG